ncbi:MAG: ABC transporter substrate-binding protein [Gammaproteobacteria bacterium]
MLITLCLFSACSTQVPDSIRFGLSTAPSTLDPRYATDAASTRINRLIYRRLVDFDEHARPLPSLARWEVVTPRHYRFILGDKGRLFHNGKNLTAEDVKATYDYVLDPDNASPHRGSVAVIEKIEVVNDDTVDFFLKTPDPLFPGRLVLGILPEDLIRKNHPFNHAPVGSGPIKFIQWSSEERLILERIRDRQIISFITVKDPTVRILKLLRGELDLIQGELPFEMINWLRKKDEVDVEKVHGDNFSYIGFNLQDPDTGNLLIRRAIARGIDRDAIIRYALGAAARKAESIFPPGHWAADPQLHGYGYDPQASRRVLLKAGYDQEHPLRLTYTTSTNPLSIRLAAIMQQQLKQVGVELDIRSYDWGTFYGDIKAGRFQMYSLSWVGLKMPDAFRYIFHSHSMPPSGANRGGFRDRQVDALIEKAEKTTDLNEQTGLYRSIQQRLREQLPYIPLWYEDNVLVKRRQIAGYALSMDGNYDGLINTYRIREAGVRKSVSSGY